MWLIFSILTVLFWGTSETIFKKSSQGDKHSVVHLLAYNGLFYGVSGVVYMLIVYKGFHFPLINVIKYLPIAFIYTLSMYSYYHAMAAVKISIISPIVNTSCVVTVLLSIFLLGQYPGAIGLIAIILIIFSLIMLSINKTPEDDIEKGLNWKPKFGIYIMGLLFAFGYFILDGVGSFLDEFTLQGRMSAEDMLISYALIYLVVGIGCYIYLKIKDKNYKFELDKYKFIGSIFETSGQYTFIYALGAGFASIVSPFVASYSVITIVLSRIFLKEKLKNLQYIWIIVAIIGIIMLSV